MDQKTNLQWICAFALCVCGSNKGESESDLHWVYCSKFLLAGLCHLLTCLEKLDGKNFSCPEEYQRTLNTTNVLVRKAEMVLTSHLTYRSEHKHTAQENQSSIFPQTPQFCLCYVCYRNIQKSVLYAPPSPPVGKKTKKNAVGCWLPWWCVFLGWFLLLSISAVSTFFTLLYGFEYGREKSTKWVMSLGLSLFQSIFILQPLKVWEPLHIFFRLMGTLRFPVARRSLFACNSQVIGVAVFFAVLLKPVALEETEEIEQVFLGKKDSDAALF